MKKNQKILITNFTYLPHVGGVENSIKFISDEFKLKGFNTIVMCGDKKSGYEKLNNIEIYRFKRQKIIKIKFFRFLNYYFDILSIIFTYIKVLKKNKIFFCISRNAICLIAIKILTPLKKVIFIPPAISFYQEKKNLDEFQGNKLKKYILKFCYNKIVLGQNLIFELLAILISTKTIVFSKLMKEQVYNFIKFKEILVIPPGIDIKKFSILNSVQKKNLKKNLKIPEGKKIFLIIARLVQVKNISFIIKLSKFVKNSHFIVVGDGPEKSKLIWLSHKLNKKNISFFDKTLNVNKFYSISDFFLMPSIYEPFGQTTLEANASGIEIVGIKPSKEKKIENANLEIIKNNTNGVLFNNSYTSAVYNLNSLNLKKNNIEKKNSIRLYVKNRYLWSKLVEKILFLI
ncbi:glycosyltransferase family 4 protein [Candidatus Pelagibacter communis]|uniref:glycosyltransferase family 4 protein n=1 Tax=Pelagibacter ubique TaxID=198252 RepID=UPI00094C40B3|nr:glycosyltransferase family 4 protein [Candidatus Pelagibacter ubique]